MADTPREVPGKVADQQDRYRQMRTNGHTDFLKSARKCRDFFLGKQWDPADIARLDKARRPHLTINKILAIVSTILGDQIGTRTELAFLPTMPNTEDTAAALNRVFKNISNRNGLDWVRSEVFSDGIITGRGYYDVRLCLDDSLTGDVNIGHLRPEYVLIDPDAETEDPREWGDVMITGWMNPRQIAEKYYRNTDIDAIVKEMQEMKTDELAFADDMVARATWGSGGEGATYYNDSCITDKKQNRTFRVLERQYRDRAKREHFVDPLTGDKSVVPENWDRDKIAQYIAENKVMVMPFMTNIVKSIVTADRYVLHEGNEPIDMYSVVPFFPYFQPGRPLGLVENLLSPQELLNKSASQELHVVNTTANSGYKVKTGTLVNMTLQDLEERGAESGIVLELTDMEGLEKITPNPYPSGLDRITFKADEAIKEISNISDSMLGQDRADVAAKAITAKQQSGQVSLIKPKDQLAKADFYLGNAILKYVQRYYTEPRVIATVRDEMTKEMEYTEVNTPQVNDEGVVEIVNDLTVGVYEVSVSQVPARAVVEDTQFEQAARLRELGVGIPDNVLIQNSRLENRADVVRQMEAAAAQPDPAAEAELRKANAEASAREADAMLKQSSAGVNQAKMEEIITMLQVQVADLASKIEERDRLAADRDNNTALAAIQTAQQGKAQQEQNDLQAQQQAEQQRQQDIATLMSGGEGAAPSAATTGQKPSETQEKK